ncbi:CDK5 regulatory subunit-associated protein 2 isoform X5 [Pimephales promelas]|uniref:CDK5 regulatory subunit-associated protein 2 isoform X5 n=1 Tax=Pimephales promelas TaxID=90988 RepID=UPI0019555E5A|nr:CDK5 regulatory subunit-associated protein 2 isoform X5 [Pimephales promelas]KAG1926239.1 myomegalin [Pimephales promelas]
MRDPCRVCGICVQGGQCRWLFSACGRLRLAVVLSHVLGVELQRDGHSEFLCGKCVFLLERVVQCDVAIEQLQETHASQLQRLQKERDGLKTQITNKYKQHNPTKLGGNASQKPLKQEVQTGASLRSPKRLQCIQRPQPKQRQAWTDNIQDTSGRSQGPFAVGIVGDGHQQKFKGRLRRCVSLEPLSRIGTDHSHRSKSYSCSHQSSDMRSRTAGGPGARPRSLSRDYLDVVHKKSTLISRSASLQSVALGQHDHALISASPFRRTQPLKNSTPGTLETTTVLFDILQLLKSVQGVRPVPHYNGSKIPVLKHPQYTRGNAHRDASWKSRMETSLTEMEEEFNDDYTPLKQEVLVERQNELSRLEQKTRQLTEELNMAKSSSQTLKHSLEEMESEKKALSDELQEKEIELAAEKKNSLKRDKTIQGLSLVLKEKEKEIEDLSGDLEEKDQALAKAREALHKAKLQKYQGAEDQQSLLLEQQAELSRLQAEAHSSLLEAQRLQRVLGSRDSELSLLQQARLQLEQELEQLQQQKKKGDKDTNDLQNQVKKLNCALADRENALEQQRLEQQEQNRASEQKLQTTIERLTASLNHKDQQLQDYMNMVRDLEKNRTQEEGDPLVAKLRARLKEKEKALEKALDDKFAAMEENENEIHLLQLSLREKERDVERLNNLLSHNEETINSFDALIKERDLELQQLLNSLKNLQRCKDETEENLQRALREKDAIIQHLKQALDNKTRDMEDMANRVLSQSESQGRDLAEQMSQRLKLTEAMLSEAVKDRERLVTENQTAVENLLATISSKDQLMRESVERHIQALNGSAAELQDLRKQLADAQMQLRNTQRLNATATQEGHLESAELRSMLAEKDSLINKLLERGQDKDRILLEMKMGEAPPPQVLELRQTIEVLQEKLEEREAELSRRNSEETLNITTVSKKSVVVLKKELTEKTEALNAALKRENQLKISIAELQSIVSELKARLEGQTANIESLTSTLKTKEEIITELHQSLSQRGDSRLHLTRDQASQLGETECSMSSLPQRERTIIGGDNQQQDVASLSDLQTEQVKLNRALRAEQHLYSDLIRAVKERDSVERLQALQLELTAVSLLRQQLESGVQMNTELRDQLQKEIQRAKQREGSNPSELESMRNALEEAQRWNTSLQARLGQIQNRGGGVGQANDSMDTLSLIGEQTSYMSICVGEGPEEELQHLTVEQLRIKVLELQAVNAELQKRMVLMENDIKGNDPRDSQKDPDLINLYTPTKQPQREQPPTTKDDATLMPPNMKERCDEGDRSPEDSSESNQQSQREQGAVPPMSRFLRDESETAQLQTLFTDCEAESVSQLREQVAKLRSEASELRGLLKEENATESKESAESSGESDSHGDLHQTVKVLRSEARGHRKIIRMLKEQLQRNSASDAGSQFYPEIMVSIASNMESKQTDRKDSERRVNTLEKENKQRESKEMEEKDEKRRQGQSTKPNKNQKQHGARHSTKVKSRLPVPVNPSRSSGQSSEDLNEVISDHVRPRSKDLTGAEESDYSTDSKMSSSSAQHGHLELDHIDDARLSPTTGTKQKTHMRQNADQNLESELVAQLELLNQECQEKEELISRLRQQVQEWDELQAELQEKDKLNREYLEALQAAESTIAYLTACSLDSECGIGQTGDVSLQRHCADLQKAVEEKDRLNAQLLDCLNTAESAIASLRNVETTSSQIDQIPGQGDPKILCERLEDLIRQVRTSQHSDDRSSVPQISEVGPTPGRDSDLRRQVDTMQESLLQQCKANAELQEKLWTSEAAVKKLSATIAAMHNSTPAGLEGKYTPESQEGKVPSWKSQQLTDCLSECIRAAEGAVQSLADVCSKPNQSNLENLSDSMLQQWLERLQRALLERESLSDPVCTAKRQQMTSTPIQNLESSKSLQQQSVQGTVSSHQNLHKNLLMLLQIHTEHAQKSTKLEKELSERGKSLGGGDAPGDESLERNGHVEGLQKALKERQRACRKLEEKLAIAQSIIALHSSNKDKQSDQHKDVDGVLRLVPSLSPVLTGTRDRFSPDITASSPSYPSSPGLSSPRPSDYHADPTVHIQQLRSQIEGQHKVIQNLQRQLRKKSLSSELLSVTSDPTVGEEDEDPKIMKAQITQLNTELEKEKTLNRASQPGSPSRIESLVQSQARELCELREQIRVSRGLGVEQRKQLLELRGALEELLQPSEMHSDQGLQLREQLDRSLGLLEKLEQVSTGGPGMDNEEEAESEMKLRLSAKLQEKDQLIQALQHQLRMQVQRMHQCSDSDMSDRLSNDGSTSFQDSPPAQRRQTPNRLHTGLKATNGNAFTDMGPVSEGLADEGGVADGGEESVRMLQWENGRLQEQLRGSEELNATLRSELDLTRSILEHDPQNQTEDEQPEQQQQNTPAGKTINSDLLAEHLQEIRALRQRLEETIRTNERLREQLERKLQEAEKDSAATNIFIAGSEEQGHISNELHFLLTQNHTLKEQLNQGARDKQKENDRLRETLARRTAKLEMSRNECETLKQERTQLQDNLYRLQCENSHQRQQLCDTQQLLQTVRVELQVHEHMKNSTQTHKGEGRGSDYEGGSAVDLSELLGEIRQLRVQLERSIQTNSTLRERLEQQLLTRTDHKSTININYLLHKTDEAGKSDVLHSQTDVPSAAHDSGSSADSGSHAPSRLVPGHRLWADRRGRHVLGLMEDYNALRKQISEAKRLTADLDTRIHDCGRAVDQLKSFSGGVNTMQQVLEEAARLLKLLWRVSLPSGDGTHTHQDDLLKSEISRLKSRLSQQERMLTGAVRRLRTTNQLKEGMERIVIDQLSLTHGVLKRARGNLESNYLNVFGLKGLQAEGRPIEWPVTNQKLRGVASPAQRSGRGSACSENSSHCSC